MPKSFLSTYKYPICAFLTFCLLSTGIILLLYPEISLYLDARETVNFVAMEKVKAFKNGSHPIEMSDDLRTSIEELEEFSRDLETRVGTILLPLLSMMTVLIFSALTFWLQVKAERRERKRMYLERFDRLAPLSKSTGYAIGLLKTWERTPQRYSISEITKSKLTLFENMMSLGFLLTDSERRKVANVLFTLEDLHDFIQDETITEAETTIQKIKSRIDQIKEVQKEVFAHYLDIDRQKL